MDLSDKLALTGIFIAIIAIVVPIVLHIKAKNKKELSYEILSSTSLLSINDLDIQKRLKITLDGVEIQNDISLVLVRIINSGNTVVKPTDFHEDIIIYTDCPIIRASVKECKPDNLTPLLETDTGEVFDFISIKPLLINSGDEFIVKLLLKSLKNQESITVSSRIEGISEVKKLSLPYPKFPIYLSLISICLMASYPIVNSFFGKSFSGLFLSFIFGIILSFVNEFIIYYRRRKTKNNNKKHFSI